MNDTARSVALLRLTGSIANGVEESPDEPESAECGSSSGIVETFGEHERTDQACSGREGRWLTAVKQSEQEGGSEFQSIGMGLWLTDISHGNLPNDQSLRLTSLRTVESVRLRVFLRDAVLSHVDGVLQPGLASREEAALAECEVRSGKLHTAFRALLTVMTWKILSQSVPAAASAT